MGLINVSLDTRIDLHLKLTRDLHKKSTIHK